MRLVPPETLMLLTGWQEVRGQPLEGKRGFCEVVRNRMRLHYQSDGTLEGTLFYPLAFSGWNARDVNRIKSLRVEDSDPQIIEIQKAWELSAGPDLVLPKDAVHYLNPAAVEKMPNWAHPSLKVAVIGAHHFYRSA